MPIFEYHCQQCTKTCELLIRSSATPVCPHCGSTQLDKLISAPAAPGKTAGILSSARSQAKREGHFSNYSATERSKIK